MSKFVEFTFCELPETPREFNIDKFRAKDPDQIQLFCLYVPVEICLYYWQVELFWMDKVFRERKR